MLIRENFVPGEIARIPEGRLVMDAEDQVEAWHEQGADTGPIAPLYYLNAVACSQLAPRDSTVVDLGCGSGRYAAYLARVRPDLKIVGLDLSPRMVETGNRALRDSGLADRVRLRVGDMTAFGDHLPADTGLISCVFALHHLEGIHDVERCLAEIRESSVRLGCGWWLFDLIRPRHSRTPYDYPRVFTPNSPEAFRLDSTYSLTAAFSRAELTRAVKGVFGSSAVTSAWSRLLPFYQAYWIRALSAGKEETEIRASVTMTGVSLTTQAQIQYRALRALFSALPG